MDSASTSGRTDLLLPLYRILPQLIEEGIQLPELELSDDDDPTDGTSKRSARINAGLDNEQWRQLYNLLKEKLRDWDLYWQVFDPITDHETIRGSLADDISDIYRDIKEGLVLLETHQVQVEEIIWHWRLLFHSHWGAHAMEALRTIHFLLDQSS